MPSKLLDPIHINEEFNAKQVIGSYPSRRKFFLSEFEVI